jgi:hypothetical protein
MLNICFSCAAEYGDKMTGNKLEVKATTDIGRNKLHLKISGDVDTNSLEKLYTDIRFCVCDIKPGFDVIVDTSQCNLLYVTSLPIYKKIIDYLISKKVGQVIRIVKDHSIIQNQFKNFTKKIQCYKASYAQDAEEAEEKLKIFKRRHEARFQLFGLTVEYRIQDVPGKGLLVDISTGGCAFELSTNPMPVDTEVILTLNFNEHDRLTSNFTINSKVVRISNGICAVQFLDLENDKKELLYQRISYEVATR